MRTAALLALLLASAPAHAGRFTFGASVAQRDDRSDHSPGLFGELRVAKRFSLRVEASKDTDTMESSTTQRLGGAAIIDVGDRGGRFTPFLLAGVTVAKTVAYWSTTGTQAGEIGAGVAATFGGDLVLSVDARIGQQRMSWTEGPDIYLANGDYGQPPEGRYTSLRAGVGVRF